MVKSVIKFECEICSKLHNTEEGALNCESFGKEEPIYKVGDFVQHEMWVEGGYGFVGYETLMVSKVDASGHWVMYDLCSEYDGSWEYPEVSYFGNEEMNEKVNTNREVE